VSCPGRRVCRAVGYRRLPRRGGSFFAEDRLYVVAVRVEHQGRTVTTRVESDDGISIGRRVREVRSAQTRGQRCLSRLRGRDRPTIRPSKGFEVLSRRWVVERTFGWMIGGDASCATMRNGSTPLKPYDPRRNGRKPYPKKPTSVIFKTDPKLLNLL
jgi:hypothetical protein